MSKFLSIGRAAISSNIFHNHSTWEISVYTAGTGIATVGAQEIPFKPGTIICYPPVIPHKEDSQRGYTEFYIHTNDLSLGNETVPVFTDTPHQTFAQIAAVLHNEYHLKEPGWEAASQDLFALLVFYLNRWRKSPAPHPLVEQLKRTLVEHFHDPEFHVGPALDALPMSRDHLRERFEQSTGKTPLQFLTDLRINEAKHLLRRGFSIKEAGARVGYPDPYYFSRIFLKTAGVRPSAYGRGKIKN